MTETSLKHFPAVVTTQLKVCEEHISTFPRELFHDPHIYFSDPFTEANPYVGNH